MQGQIGALLVCLALFLPQRSYADIQVSPSVSGSAAVAWQTGQFRMQGTLGQSSPISSEELGTFKAYQGFWHAATGAQGSSNGYWLAPMELTGNVVNGVAYLTWNPVAGARGYEFFRSPTQPFASEDVPLWFGIQLAPESYTVEATAIANPTYFLGRAFSSIGWRSPDSGIVGTIQFPYGEEDAHRRQPVAAEEEG